MEDVPRRREQYEIVTTERLIRAVAGVSTDLWRMPFDDGEDVDGTSSRHWAKPARTALGAFGQYAY